MATLNKVMLIGRLTKNPEPPRALGSTGNMVISFRLAVGRSKKNAETGQWEPDPNPLYIDCEVFSGRDGNTRLLDLVKNYFQQGTEIYLEGRLQFDEWDNRETGKKQSKHKVVVSEIQFVGARQDSGGGGGGGGHEDEEVPRQQAPPRRAPATQTPRANTNGPARKQPVYNEPEPDNGGNEEDIPF